MAAPQKKRHPRRSKASPITLTVQERRAYAYRLKQAGATYRDIAAALQNDPNWIHRLPASYT